MHGWSKINHRSVLSVALVVAVALLFVAPPLARQVWVASMAPIVLWGLWRELQT